MALLIPGAGIYDSSSTLLIPGVGIVQAAASAGTTVNANAASVTLAGQSANVNAARNIAANVNALQLLAQAATVSVSSATTISAQIAAVTLAAQAATVNAAKNIGANVASVSLAAQNASIITGNLVSAGVASITLAGQAATVNAARNIAANAAALNINALAASVSLGVSTPPNAETFSGWNVAKRVILPATNDWRTLHIALTNELQQVWTRASDMAERTTKIDTSSIVAHGLVLADASSATVAVNLIPAADWSNRTIRVKKTDATANTVLIVPQSGETVDGAATKTISTQYSVITVYSDGQQWHIV